MFSQIHFLKDNFADEERLVHFVKLMGGAPPTTGAVRKWYDRGSVPTEWFAQLLMLLEIDRGAPVSLIKYDR